MKLDRALAREISKAANECESRAFMRKIRETKKSLSTPDVCHAFGECISKCGRVPVAICVAATIIKRRDRLRAQTVRWAEAVLALWKNKPDDIDCIAYIDDNLHPTRIEEYAGSFIRLMTEEP
jgi:hypothetical protein